MKRLSPIFLAALLVVAGCTSLTLPDNLTREPAELRRELAKKLDESLADGLLQRAQVGMCIQELKSGRTVYARQADTLLIPASNVKLMTAAAVLERWGQAYQLKTFFIPNGKISGKTFTGNLIILSEGDPSLQESCVKDPLAYFKIWAEKLKSRGIEKVDGNIIVVETNDALQGYGAGWGLDDLPWGYAAPVSRSQIFGNKIRVVIDPPSVQNPQCRIRVSPPEAASRLVCDVRAGFKNDIRVTWEPFEKQILISGVMLRESEAETLTLGMPDPPVIYGEVFKRILEGHGIAVSGHVVIEPALPESVDVPFVDRQYSPPLADLLSVMLKESDNHLAESLIRILGDAREELSFSSAAGREAAKIIVLGAGADVRNSRYADASGISRYNLFCANHWVDLLRVMGKSESARSLLWRHLLPLAGQEGTLKERFKGTALEANLRAKSGSMSNIRALSGYFTAASGEDYVFSILINGTLLPGELVQKAMDEMLLECYEAL